MKKSCSSRARPRARARRRTRRGGGRRPGSRLELEEVGGALVGEEPALRFDQVAPARMREAADAVGGYHAMAGYDDRQPVVAAGLADRARLGVQALRERAVRERLAARDLAQRVPKAPLERRAFDEPRKIEAGVGVRE